jgi:F-type H+-transporting ATPase subunit beta
MVDDLKLNVPLLRKRVPNLTTAARELGLRPATVSNLCTGKIPIGRAEVRTLAILASLAHCSMDELIVRGSGTKMIETGIKVLDLFAPIVRGGTVGSLTARQGLGQFVMMAELFYRVKQRGYKTILWEPEYDAEDKFQIQKNLTDAFPLADFVGRSLAEVLGKVVECGMESDVLLGADRSIVLSGELVALRQQLVQAGVRPLTIVLVDAQLEAVDEEAPYGPLDTLLRFDSDLASRSLFPAVDPVASTSTVLEGAQLEAAHIALQQRARKTLRRYRELRFLVDKKGVEAVPEWDTLTYHRGERLEAFLSQPFYTAEPYSKIRGEWLPLQETLDGVRRILDGAADELEPKQLKYTGSFGKEQVKIGGK